MKTTMKHCASLLLLAVTAIAALASCSGNDVTDGDRLPDGKYPMTFTATGLEAMATSRATADGTWDGGEEVAVMIGSEVRQYTSKSSGSSSTTLEAANGKTPFYWQTNNDKKTVSAWYPYATPPSSVDKRPASFTVQTDQRDTDGYQKSDFLFANPVEVSFGGSEGLTFKHLPAKVLINLKADAGSGVTTGDVETATVTLVNQATVGAITYDATGAATVAQAAEGTADITPKTMTTGSGYQKTVQALLVPRQMKNKQFIKVAIDNRNYYYIPTNDDANLQSGLQYTYEITVKKEGISVSKVSGEWKDEDWGSVDATSPTSFKIHLSTSFTATTNTNGCKVTDANGNVLTATDGVYTAPSNEINFSITADEGYILSRFRTKKQKGSDYNEEYSYDAATRTYTCRLYGLRSDLWLENIEVKEFDISNPPDPEVGDYYYEDGTWSAFLLPQLTIAGIVFKVGAGNGDTANYGDKLINSTIHGYVVALNDVSTSIKWNENKLSNNPSYDLEAFNGYENTNNLRNEDVDNFQTNYPAAYQCYSYKTQSAPDKSSGWYMPSYAQLKEVFAAIQNAGFTGKSGFDNFKDGVDIAYWTSTERDEGWAYTYLWDAWENNNTPAAVKKWDRLVRAILTF